MTWQEDVAKKVEEAEERVEEVVPRIYAARLKMFLDRFLPYALILLGSLAVLNFVVNIGQSTARVITYLNWILISYFSIRLAMAFRLAESNRKFLENHWFDALIVIPAFTLAQEMRAFTALERIGIGEEETVAGILATRNAGVASQITRIIKIIKRSISF